MFPSSIMWEYPFWDVPRLGGGMVIALIATIHVVVAHFSVGAGVLLILGERRARATESSLLLDFIRRYSKVLLLVGFVFGAITGVAIWFSISLASTRATSALIHTFVWFWAMEWVFFLVEIVAGYAYYSTWDKVSAQLHMTLGWIYAFAAWMSLFIISGILAFMLTPGDWVETRNVWHGFLNPSFLPTVVLRTASSLAIAGLAGIILANLPSHWSREDRTQLINFCAWFLAPLALMLPVAGWYFAVIPPFSLQYLQGGAAPMMLFLAFGITASTLVGLYAFIGLLYFKRYVNRETACLLFAIAVIATVSMEFVREGVRKPFIIQGYLYSNGLTVPEIEKVNNEGVLPNAPWHTLAFEGTLPPQGEIGRIMYQVQCSQCHVQDGFNDLKPLIATWSKDLLVFNLDHLHELKPFMPPLVGNPAEREALADYLWDLKTHIPLDQQDRGLAMDSRFRGNDDLTQEGKVAAAHEPDPQS